MKKIICNQDVRKAAKANGIFMYEIAKQLKISEFSLSRKLRYELEQDEKEKIFSAIDKICEDYEKRMVAAHE